MCLFIFCLALFFALTHFFIAVAILLGVLEKTFLPSMQLSTHKESLVSGRGGGVVGGGEEGGKVLVNKSLT